MGPRALSLPLSNQLQSGQGQRSCRLSALIPSEEPEDEQLFWALYPKPTAVFYDQRRLSRALAFPDLKPDPFAPGPICGTHVLPQLPQFWVTFRAKLAGKGPYKASIGGMRLRLLGLQHSDHGSLITACLDLSAERPFDRLCDRTSDVNRLEKRDLRLDTRHHRWADKNDTLRAGTKSHNQCTRPRESFFRCDIVTSKFFQTTS